jgi:hypothetical protein
VSEENIKDDEILKSQHLVTMILANHMFISRICLSICRIRKIKETNIKTKKKGIMVKHEDYQYRNLSCCYTGKEVKMTLSHLSIMDSLCQSEPRGQPC